MDTTLTFKPRPSTGWLWLVIIGAATLLVLLPPMLAVMYQGYSGGMLFPFYIGIVVAAMAFMLAAMFPTMRYELRPTTLALIFGPWTVYKIPYQAISRVAWQDLRVSPLSSFRLPGFALWSVPYIDAGILKMCATACANHILVIYTDKNKFGITPADEQGFVSELLKRVKG